MKSKWSFEVTRGGLVPVLIADLVVAYFYFGFLLTEGKQGLPPLHTNIYLVGTHSFLLLIFIFELIGNTVVTIRQTVRGLIAKHKELS
ncbi:MAG: hypothetical protein NUW00_03865 [Candidatus Kaiserbacteria bacterium]|nr:hypothetical protein [Candidatus Kaiserbacteria bacterium]